MAADLESVRLELVKTVLPHASRQGLSEPKRLIEICTALETYVLGSVQGENPPDSPTPKRTGRPRKETSESTLPSFLQDPAPADKSN